MAIYVIWLLCFIAWQNEILMKGWCCPNRMTAQQPLTAHCR
jgi:hypothetical protein